MGLCKTDEVGEICMRASSVGSSFWGLPGLTNATFRAKPENDDESVAFPDQEFVRTGLLGFLGPVSVCRDRIKACVKSSFAGFTQPNTYSFSRSPY